MIHKLPRLLGLMVDQQFGCVPNIRIAHFGARYYPAVSNTWGRCEQEGYREYLFAQSVHGVAKTERTSAPRDMAVALAQVCHAVVPYNDRNREPIEMQEWLSVPQLNLEILE